MTKHCQSNCAKHVDVLKKWNFNPDFGTWKLWNFPRRRVGSGPAFLKLVTVYEQKMSPILFLQINRPLLLIFVFGRENKFSGRRIGSFSPPFWFLGIFLKKYRKNAALLETGDIFHYDVGGRETDIQCSQWCWSHKPIFLNTLKHHVILE